MNTMMILETINMEHPSKALENKQGLSLAYTFLIEREQSLIRTIIV